MDEIKLSVVMPVYNETNTLERIISKVESVKLPGEISELELVIVDDYSTDSTRDILKHYSDHHTVILHDKNRGKGKALQTGFKAAGGDIIIIQDADLEYDPNDYGKLLTPIINGRADVVYGSRFLKTDSRHVLHYWHTQGNKLLTWFSNMMTDLDLTDMETCYKAFRRPILEKLLLCENRFGIEPELTAKVAHLVREGKCSVFETAISYHGRSYGEGKKIGVKDALRAFYCILKYNNSRVAKLTCYAMMGIMVALSQILTLIVLVELAGLEGLRGENIANVISIEISILTGFFLHSSFTWHIETNGASRNWRRHLKALWVFHGVTLLSIFVRIGLFYGLSLTPMPYLPNALIGILAAVILNFTGYNRIVFKKLPMENI